MTTIVQIPIDSIRVRAFTVPTDSPEGDGTLRWDSTTLVLVELTAGERTGIGYSYTAAAAVPLIRELLEDEIVGADALSPRALWERMRRAVRNVGYPGLTAAAVSAVDIAAWDLRARMLDVSLITLLGRVRSAVPVYGSGGFTTYNRAQMERQLTDWLGAGITMVKIKVGAEPERDRGRVIHAREVIGGEVELFVDANGAYTCTQASMLAEHFASDAAVVWFEEPVSSDDIEGLRRVRDHAPVGMRIAAGEYGYDLFYFQRTLDAQAVDVMQADVTRCGGVTQFMQVQSLCATKGIKLSAHTSPAVHAHLGAAVEGLEHVEYFHDHARIEAMLFDGVPPLRDGHLHPDPGVLGMGLSLREPDALRYEV